MNVANSHSTTWKGEFQAFLHHWESPWLLIDKSTPISNQESPAVHKSMLCNSIHSNLDFLQLEHLDKLGQAQSTSKITYHNYLTLLHSTAFQLDLKMPKHSAHHTQGNTTNSTSNNSNNNSGHGHNGGHGGHGNDNKSNANPNWISLPKELWESLPASVKSTISQQNHHYNVNTVQQDNAGCIPKVLWD